MNEVLTRYIFDSDHVFAKTGRPKPAAFKKNGRGISVYRTLGLMLGQVFHLGKFFVEEYRMDETRLVGFSTFSVEKVPDDLKITPLIIPNFKHTDLRHKNTSPEREKMIRTELADACPVCQMI